MIFLNCQTTTDPIIYDKSIEKIDKEVELIRYLINDQNYEAAQKQIDENLKEYPDNIDLLHMKAWLYLSMNDLDESKSLFLEILSRNKSNPLVLAGLSRIERIQNNYVKALEYAEKGLKLQPLHSLLWLERGLIKYYQQDYRKALSDFTKAASLDSNNYDAKFLKYLSYIKNGKEIDDIKHNWIELKESGKIEDWYYRYHAQALYELNKKKESLDIIKEGIEAYPDDPYMLNFYAYLLYEEYIEKKDENIKNEALENIKKCMDMAFDLEPEFVNTYLLLLDASGEQKKLKKELNKYYLLFPDSELIINWIKKNK